MQGSPFLLMFCGKFIITKRGAFCFIFIILLILKINPLVPTVLVLFLYCFLNDVIYNSIKIRRNALRAFKKKPFWAFYKTLFKCFLFKYLKTDSINIPAKIKTALTLTVKTPVNKTTRQNIK